jgi:hypothetical protein
MSVTAQIADVMSVFRIGFLSTSKCPQALR